MNPMDRPDRRPRTSPNDAMSMTFEPSVPPPRRGTEPQDAPSRVDVLPVPAVLFGLLSLILFVTVWMWPPEGGPWGPATSALLGWLLFAVHIVSCRRYLNSFDPAIWVPVLILLFYLGTPIAVELLGSGTMREYDSWRLGIVPPRINQAFRVDAALPRRVPGGPALRRFSRPLARRLQDGDATEGSVPVAMTIMLGGLALTVIGIGVIGPGLLFGGYGEMKYAMTFGKADFRFWGTDRSSCRPAASG